MIKNGNSFIDATETNNWLVGKFDNAEAPIENENIELKFSKQEKGSTRSIESASRDLEKDTVIILISGKFKVIFPENTQEIILENEGDYVNYSAGVLHAWESLEDSLVLTVRIKN